MSRDYAFGGSSKLDGAKWPWAMSITAIRPNEVVRRETTQTACIFNLASTVFSTEHILCRAESQPFFADNHREYRGSIFQRYHPGMAGKMKIRGRVMKGGSFVPDSLFFTFRY